MKSYFDSLARYNRWANRRFYDAVASLSADEIAAPRIGFFPSLLKTLNHLVVTDRIWLSRLTATPDTEAKALDQIIAADFADLSAQRAALDARIVDFVQGLAPARLSETLVYKTMAGMPYETPVNMVLAHMFNHQTHHRGQAHGMLSGTTVPPPSLDMIVFLREEAAG
ncbi:DinB family protein [Dongia rigui]|uniref:DinB family protein n=1 Tax=Dongia rigui TaxID=940149 RepID=A0ABU5DYE6_9PROT|nr:DinB family protein [Dongia rigui]MDY0872361.1 DinB family protein [Dongia rigui]